MATKAAKAKAIIDALADPVVVNAAMINRIANAFAFTYARDKTGLTQEEIAGLFLVALRDLVKQVVFDAEVSKAMEVTRLASVTAATINLGEDGKIEPVAK